MVTALFDFFPKPSRVRELVCFAISSARGEPPRRFSLFADRLLHDRLRSGHDREHGRHGQCHGLSASSQFLVLVVLASSNTLVDPEFLTARELAMPQLNGARPAAVCDRLTFRCHARSKSRSFKKTVGALHWPVVAQWTASKPRTGTPAMLAGPQLRSGLLGQPTSRPGDGIPRVSTTAPEYDVATGSNQ
ncbi:hypothetical protein QYE76_060268 [Lolium multiflorum]|uniref:Uncharacterized protein n=1 Tax=Lolium multiflorum TaxID=4521 RepID=A0AAD8S041_LOLMU|nr:hypothetical protein QYE76_060268 [Lolium multiflorum]